MCTYQRWCHQNGGVGDFGVYGVCGGMMETVEGDMGRIYREKEGRLSFSPYHPLLSP